VQNTIYIFLIGVYGGLSEVDLFQEEDLWKTRESIKNSSVKSESAIVGLKSILLQTIYLGSVSYDT